MRGDDRFRDRQAQTQAVGSMLLRDPAHHPVAHGDPRRAIRRRRRDGDRLVIEPVRKRGLLALLETMKPFDGEFPEIEDRPPAPEKIF